MTHTELAKSFIKRFCEGQIKDLHGLLAEDLQFNGSLFQFNSRDAYLASLYSDPPEVCNYTLLSVTENTDSVAIFYLYEKPSGAIKIAQLFKFNDNKISHIDLVFDTGQFR